MSQPLVTRPQLVADLRALGATAGQTVMLHASVKAIGWVVGGPDVILDALLEILTPTGTLMMYVGYEDPIHGLQEWTPEHQQAYRAAYPPFDPATTRAYREWGILTEYLRTRPNAHRSLNPGASMAAVGAQAQWLTQDHPLQYGYGQGSPLAKLVKLEGKVLILGSPLQHLTLIHHAEHLANIPDKHIVHYSVPIVGMGWVEIEEYDTGDGIRPWAGVDYFQLIAEAYVATGKAQVGTVGQARSYLFAAPALTTFAVNWLEKTFNS
ncbi:MAG: aminoglycoside 3-N-acetyltransferase [Anaerolineales bacterium]|nr:aminoglycoside 3-N-acetyltransferase [Anaerolineales bacterium]